jgi:UDP-2,3-diacylglucosamine hydrolase
LKYLIYGHYHYPIDEQLGDGVHQVVLGDWITHFTYAVFDGKELQLRKFEG